MSFDAMKAVRRMKDIVNPDKPVLMMMGWRVPKGRVETEPTSLEWLADSVGIDKKTLLHVRRRLVAKGKVVVAQFGRGPGAKFTFILPFLAGPLFSVETGGAPDFLEDGIAGGAPGSPPREGEAGGAPAIATEKRAVRPPSLSTDLSSKVRTTKTTTTAKKPVAADICEAALQFVDWFATTYPTHNQGSPVTYDIEEIGPAVVALLSTEPPRTVERLQAMALAMWTVTLAEDPWLPSARDRGLKLLCHAADRLDRISRARERSAEAQGPDVRETWSRVCAVLVEQFDEPTRARWLSPLQPISDDGATFRVSAPTRQHVIELPSEIEAWLKHALRQLRPGVRLHLSCVGDDSKEASA